MTFNAVALLFLIAGLALIGWLAGRARSAMLAARGGGNREKGNFLQHKDVLSAKETSAEPPMRRLASRPLRDLCDVFVTGGVMEVS